MNLSFLLFYYLILIRSIQSNLSLGAKVSEYTKSYKLDMCQHIIIACRHFSGSACEILYCIITKMAEVFGRLDFIPQRAVEHRLAMRFDAGQPPFPGLYSVRAVIDRTVVAVEIASGVLDAAQNELQQRGLLVAGGVVRGAAVEDAPGTIGLDPGDIARQ